MTSMIGKKFGRWTVIEATARLVGVAKHKAWICQCDCSRKTKRVVTEYSLTSHKSRSCGKCPDNQFRRWMPNGLSGVSKYRKEPQWWKEAAIK